MIELINLTLPHTLWYLGLFGTTNKNRNINSLLFGFSPQNAGNITLLSTQTPEKVINSYSLTDQPVSS
jgi:hypothetical protein